ncbi:MAG: hypothetical protein A2Z32_06130 [Chloroflexi bacterium RBG_16_69_14]|nr:MAG: hypothetical protein A2Z32_06130 [Chloroflexi bacterium RBG_16_69_14]
MIGRIATGGQHTCALTSVGEVKCWGSNESGQLGNGTTTDSTVPVDVAGLGNGVKTIAAGGRHTCALTSEGGVRCWGANESGQLGNGTTSDSSAPVAVSGMEIGVVAIASGGGHTCALTVEGGVKCWGSNSYQQLGNGTTTDSRTPGAVSDLASGVGAIAAGDIHSCALTSGGGVKCWGYAGSGGLGGGVPDDVPGLATGVTSIAASYEQTCALTVDHVVKCWSGFDGSGPVDVSGLGSGTIAISAGFDGHTCALTTGGMVKCWGGPNDSIPVDVAGLESGVTAIAAGGWHTCAVIRGGGVRCWGDNWSGQLGNGRPCSSWSGSSVPVDVRFGAPTSGYEPATTPIEHATGPADVVLRFDRGPDVGVGDLSGELFQPGPEFTLYGDGTVIFRNDLAPSLPADGPIIRARPFHIAHLDENQVQALLRFALEDGGLGDACEEYGTQASDVVGTDVFTIRADGLDKRVKDAGSGPFGALTDDLRNFDRRGIPTTAWVPERYWGNLIDAGIFEYIGDGQPPGLADTGSVPWPWPGIRPGDFAGRDEGGWIGYPRRIMSAAEAAVLGLSDNGGVVHRIYLRGPDRKTLYYFSLWPMLPDETG